MPFYCELTLGLEVASDHYAPDNNIHFLINGICKLVGLFSSVSNPLPSTCSPPRTSYRLKRK